MEAKSNTQRRIQPRAVHKTLSLIWAETDVYAKRKFVWSVVFLVCASGASALTPVVYKLLIDALSNAPLTDPWSTPAVLIAIFVLAQFAARTASTLRGLVHGQGLQRLSRRIGVRLFRHVVCLPLPYHLERKTGAIGETLGQGLRGCHTLLQHIVFTFLPVIVEFIAIALVLVHYGHWKYLLLFAVSSLLYAITFGRAAQFITKPSEEVATASIEANATLTDTLLNYETVKYFSGERSMTSRLDSTLALLETRWSRLLGIQTKNGLVVSTIFTASLGAALAMAGADVVHGTMTIGDFVLINTYAVRLIQPLETIGYAVRDMAQALGFLQQMLRMLDEKTETDAEQQRAQSANQGELKFEHVSLSYGEGRFGLKDITFTVPAGHTVAVVGASGSGKSSLVRLLFRLYEPTTGRIHLDGQPISEMSLECLRKQVSVVPQDTVLFNDTIGFNLRFGDPSATQEMIEAAARIANLEKFIDSLPDRYETRVGERGLKLSGGEKQRMAIARAALKRPKLFVFDEATSSLDSRTEREIISNIIAVSKRCSTLIIAHRLSTVVHADQILVLHNGYIVERGTHLDLLEIDGRYRALWRAQHNTKHGNVVVASEL